MADKKQPRAVVIKIFTRRVKQLIENIRIAKSKGLFPPKVSEKEKAEFSKRIKRDRKVIFGSLSQDNSVSKRFV